MYCVYERRNIPQCIGVHNSYGRPQKFFQGGQSRHFAYSFQVADDSGRMGRSQNALTLLRHK